MPAAAGSDNRRATPERTSIGSAWRPDLAARLPGGVINEFRKLNFDIVSTTNPPAMAALLALTTASRLLFGTDIPYVTAESTVSELAGLGLSAADIRAIECDNALALMPSLRR